MLQKSNKNNFIGQYKDFIHNANVTKRVLFNDIKLMCFNVYSQTNATIKLLIITLFLKLYLQILCNKGNINISTFVFITQSKQVSFV